MSNAVLELGNLVVICVTCLLIYLIPGKLSFLFIIPAICFQIYVFQKYYETHKATIEYQYAVLALILFVAGYFMPKSMFNMFITFSILSLSRCGISLFAVGEKEDLDKLIEQTIANTKLELQAQMQEQLRNAQAQMQNNAPLTEVEINNKVEAIRNLLMQEQTRKIKELESQYNVKMAQYKSQNQESIKQLNILLAKKDQEMSSLKHDTTAMVNDYVEEYKRTIEEQNKKIKSLTEVNEQQAETISQQKKTIDKLLAKQDDFISKLEKQNHDNTNVLISNSEIHTKLLAVFREAKHEVNIMSPWINNAIVNSVFEDRLEMLIRKGGKLKVVYGINMQNNDPKRVRAEKILKNLQDKYGKKHIQYKYFSSHSKLIICDDEYYIITSCNPLSNDGMSWEEIGEISTNKHNLKAYKKKYFSNF